MKNLLTYNKNLEAKEITINNKYLFVKMVTALVTGLIPCDDMYLIKFLSITYLGMCNSNTSANDEEKYRVKPVRRRRITTKKNGRRVNTSTVHAT